MQKLQDSVFSIVKTVNLSPAVFSFLQPSEDLDDKTPLGGILKDTKHGWLALGPKFCVVDLRTGLKIAARIFGTASSNFHMSVTSVVELPTPLTDNSIQLVISLQSENTGMICVLHVNGSQILRSIHTEVVVTELAVCDRVPDGPFMCFDGAIMAGTKSGELIVFDLNRASLLQALKDISQGYEHLLHNETNPSNLSFLPLHALQHIDEQRELALENDHHLAILLNENSLVDNQYIFRNPDGTVRMKAKRDHIRVTVLQYIPQLGSLAVGYNFGAFQIWNLMTLDLEFTSQVNVECLPVTHFGFQEPCDDPRAFCYLWVVFSVIDRFEEEEFPLAVMYSLTYHGKRMLSDTKCLYQDFSTAAIRFQIELSTVDDNILLGGKCVSCHTYSVNSSLGDEGEDTMLNICQLVWECWGENASSSTEYGMLLFDLDQWYKDHMPATQRLESNAFMSTTRWAEGGAGAGAGSGGACALAARLEARSLAVYAHATRLEEHFYPNSLQYDCICLNTSEAYVLSTIGIQRQIISSMDEIGPTVLLNPPRLYNACVSAGLTPLYMDAYMRNPSPEDQRRFLLSVALEARLSRFLKRCAHDWATGSHSGAGCTLTFLVDWCWKRAIDLKENARDLTAPLFASSALPDRNVVRCLEHCVKQLTQLTGLLDAVLTKCCNLVVPDALTEMEEKLKGISTVSLYFQVVQWFLRVGLLPERRAEFAALPYPAAHLYDTYNKRRLKLNRLQDNATAEDNGAGKSCSLLYIDQLIDHEFGGERIHEMWLKGGSECNGLYPPPSLYSLLRLYLLPDIAEEHKHSLVLYLLVDYSMVYDESRYEAVIRRLMQFPTMFGLSNTAIKATQAFWHLDHRDFDFALDQLQCLTGNTLSPWQHNAVLSSLVAQRKSQAALQYLQVRKPPPVQRERDGDMSLGWSGDRVNDYDKLEEWHASCGLHLARGLLFDALDVVRICVENTADTEDKVHFLNYFFKGCRNTGQLSKILELTLLPFEEEVFIKYLENCNEPQTSEILIMYYLQQSRYIEAERYNKKLKQSKPNTKDMSTSAESLFEVLDRESARDTIVELVCSSLPQITNTVAHVAFDNKVIQPHVIAPKPLSVYIQAQSPKNTFTYKSSFIQDTIENASETWINKPKMRRGLKRALNIEETPFICTPKLSRTKKSDRDNTNQFMSDVTPPKRAKWDLTGTPKMPKMGSTFKAGAKLSAQMAALLDMPEVQSPDGKLYNERSGAETPHSILKLRRNERDEAPSPTDSRYLGDSDDEMLETASHHTHCSDSTNKHLRFTIPTASESGSTPSPGPSERPHTELYEREPSTSVIREKEIDISTDSFVTTTSHGINENHPLESPPKKMATEENVKTRKTYKDSVRARRSLSISANSSLSEDPNTSIESIADIPVTLLNPRYRRETHLNPCPLELHDDTVIDSMVETRDVDDVGETETERGERGEVEVGVGVPRTPKGRRGIRSIGESTPLVNRSRSVTPERQDSPVVTPLRSRITRSRSRTPELSPRSSSLDPIPEQPKQEVDSEPHALKSTLSVPRPLRSRSRTPERVDKGVSESPKLEVIKESPTKSSNTDSSSSSPTRRSLRSRSRTPEVEVVSEPTVKTSPRSLRSRSKTPEKLMSPKKEQSARGKKSLSRLVLEANTFAKTKQNIDKNETETTAETKSDNVLECTPMKTLKQVPCLMDVTLSPIANKSVLQSSTDSALSETVDKESKSVDKSNVELGLKPLPAFATIHEAYFEKSVLRSYQSSVAESSHSIQEEKVTKNTDDSEENVALKTLPDFATINVTGFEQSVLHSYESSVAEASQNIQESVEKLSETSDKSLSKPFAAFAAMIETDFEKSVLRSYQSSIGETSQEINISKDTKTQEALHSKSGLKDNSSLITNDSDIEMKEDVSEWHADVESQDTAAVIQKEKEKIVEIVREINEIEDDMSDDSDSDSDDGSSGDEEIVVGEAVSSSSDSETSSSSTDEDIISIKDTDSDHSASPSSDRLQIDEQSTNTNKQATEQAKVETIVEVQIENDIPSDKKEPNISELIEGSSSNPLNQDQELPQIEDDTENIKKDTELSEAKEGSSTDPLNQGQISIMTDDNSVIESEQSISLNYSVEKVDETQATDIITTDEKAVETNAMPIVRIEVMVEPIAPIEEKTIEEPTPSPKGIDVVDAAAVVTPTEIENKPKEIDEVKISEVENVTEKDSEKESQIDKDSEGRTRKRTKSVSSNKSTKEIEIEEPKTPITRKRTQSNASNKSVTEPKQNSPDNTPSRRRAKTPTSTDVRKIITRRVSREMSETMDDSKVLSDESLISTPKRRSTRARSKNIDDNESVASESSMISTRSKASEDAEAKPTPRKGRKSILATKPDLSVIPEVIAEESGIKEGVEDVINEYSSSRRLTRRQKAVLESWLAEPSSPSPSPATSPLPPPAAPPRPAAASRTSRASVADSVDDDASSTRSAFDVQPIDRLSLLNKTDFEGSPDIEELHINLSPESVASDASKLRRSRLARAASETKTTPKSAKGIRRGSVDIAGVSGVVGVAGAAGAATPERGRRASFARACEALHTPRGRRPSTDSRKSEIESPPESPRGGPGRRPRRGSTHSNTSQAALDTSKRSKKMPVVEEVRDSKK